MTLRYAKPPTQRQLRVAEQIRQLVAGILIQGNIYHPALTNAIITIPEVRISADLKLVTAFITANADEELIAKVLNFAAPEIRKLIMPKLSLKYAPEIRFIVDTTTDQATKMESIFAKLERERKHDKDKNPKEDGSSS
jgi:ribosome-binding factor A